MITTKLKRPPPFHYIPGISLPHTLSPSHPCRRRLFTTSSTAAHADLLNESQNGQRQSKPRVIFSGIQPTGIPHLGNYLGALSNWVKLQNTASPSDELLFSIVGWHALTLPQDPQKLREARMDILAVLLAIGIDPDRAVVFHQDHNPNHTELAWIFNCITPMGKLRRMTTWKSRLATSRNIGEEDAVDVDDGGLNLGLFAYPVLQAADILAYRATHVPVGDDQTQHLELCRVIADQFNRNFKGMEKLFPLPIQLNTPSKRILSLRDPTSKMSKSAPDTSSRILLTDPPSTIANKIRSAVTDSIPGITYDPVNRPGTANLLTILAACNYDNEDVQETAGRYVGKNHGALKKDLTEAVVELLKGPREKFEKLRTETGYLEQIAQAGAEKARSRSEATMVEVRKRVGLA